MERKLNYSVEILQDEKDKKDYLSAITTLMTKLLKRKGQEQFEFQIDTIGVDIAQELGGSYDRIDNTLRFSFAKHIRSNFWPSSLDIE